LTNGYVLWFNKNVAEKGLFHDVMAKILFDGPEHSSDGFKFLDNTGVVTAVLDVDGKFTLKDANASLEMFPSWSDFVVSFGDKPVNAKTQEDVISQLTSMGLGEAVPIVRPGASTRPPKVSKPAVTKPAADVPAATKLTKENEVAKKAPAKPVKKAAKKGKADVVLQPCKCGCDTKVAKNFAAGHDARLHGYQKKIERGEAKFSDYPAIAVAFMKSLGTKQGTKPKE
jgi:hypothetical protein